ncbi:hypothetical protein DYB26_011646, partial [Aphanomyces astaci]
RFVYVAVGKAPTRVSQILQLLKQLDILPYTTVVAADDRQPLIMQYLAPFAGCRIAESWLQDGVTKNAIVVYDDLSAHTMTRLLLIGEMNVHNIKADKMDKPKERRVVPIAQLSKISMSSLHDNYLFLHVNNDVGLMYEVDQKTEVELCKRDLPVTISDTIEFEAKKGMRLAFRFVKNQSTTVTTMEKLDKKNGQVNVGTKY